MDIFCIRRKSGEVVKSGFNVKEEAKAVRNDMVREMGYTQEDFLKFAEDNNSWPLMISKGKDHWASSLPSYN